MYILLFSVVGGQIYILRTCFHGEVSNPTDGCKIDPQNIFVKQIDCEVCSKDFCNGSTSLTPLAFAVITFFGIARLLS